MKSSTGKYYVGLDHVRALAAFMVFTWHFITVNDGQFSPPPQFPLSLLTEGHTGVALFMTLSGYLFAKLLDGRNINFASFLWNRFIRLAPLLVLFLLIAGLKIYSAGHFDPYRYAIRYAKLILWGLIKPTLPFGAWSITAEFHFYFFLPFLLFLSAKSKYFLPLFIVGMIILRIFLYLKLGTIQSLAYYTIVGRVDQFVLGILAYQHRHLFKGRHIVALLIFLGFAAFYWYFDSLGGYYEIPKHSSAHAIWILLTTVEGLAYASLISWYDNSFDHSVGRFSRFIALIGTYSYSIYLVHVFFVFDVPPYVDKHLISLSNIYIALLISPFAFVMMIPFGWASYKFIESPFLKFRTRYILEDRQTRSDANVVETPQISLTDPN